MENKDCIKEQWVLYYKDQIFYLGGTSNNKLESMFKHVESVCSNYSTLIQIFSGSISVLNTFRSQRNYLYLMALNRKPTIASMNSSLKKCLSNVVSNGRQENLPLTIWHVITRLSVIVIVIKWRAWDFLANIYSINVWK